MQLLAAEGGYQEFTLGGAEWFWLIFAAVTALVALAVGLQLMRGVLAADQGTPKMIEIAKAIQEGALAYLTRQMKTIAVITIPVGIIVFVTSTAVVRPDRNGSAELPRIGHVSHACVPGGMFHVGCDGLHRHEPCRAR